MRDNGSGLTGGEQMMRHGRDDVAGSTQNDIPSIKD